VRELQNVLKRILVIDSWQEIIQALPRAPQVSARAEAPEPSTVIAPDVPSQDQQIASFVEGFFRKNQTENIDLSSFSLKAIKKKAVDQIEREIIAYVLDKTNWNRSKASKILKISYKTLLYKISDLEITPPSRNGADFF
jgi:DNA-binding NtrC family response regulator